MLQLVLTYTPVSEGHHDLPLFLNINSGKHLQLRLTGTTVPWELQAPMLLPSDQHFMLQPAPIGEWDPPLQCYTLRNAGPATLCYSLDISPLKQLAKDNYNFDVMRYMGGAPLKGMHDQLVDSTGINYVDLSTAHHPSLLIRFVLVVMTLLYTHCILHTWQV